jgi:AcrR family transcriptional regulator
MTFIMKNKEIQEERMRRYFIDATKAIIKGEGIRGVSVRSVADHAGYSFATIYNYFRDVNILLFECVQDFQEECRVFAEDRASSQPDCRAMLKAKVVAYVTYFTEYPGIFELFYTARVGDLGNKESTLDIIAHSLDNICEPEWQYCMENGSVSEEKATMIKARLRYTITGLLVLYLNRRRPLTYPAFREELQRQVDDIIGI